MAGRRAASGVGVGCQGFAGCSLCEACTMLDITGAAKKSHKKTTMEAAERASRWLRIRRSDQWDKAAGLDQLWPGHLKGACDVQRPETPGDLRHITETE